MEQVSQFGMIWRWAAACMHACMSKQQQVRCSLVLGRLPNRHLALQLQLHLGRICGGKRMKWISSWGVMSRGGYGSATAPSIMY